MKKVFFMMLVLVLTIALALPAMVVSASPATMTVVSDDSGATVITKVYNKAGGGNSVVDLSGSPLTAVRAQEPKPYPTGYVTEGAEVTDSVWDNGVDWFEDNASGADWIWETERAEDPASLDPGDARYDADAARYGRVVLFETTFNIPGVPTSATLHIAADNGYEAWVNGSTHYLSPTVGGSGWESSNLWETNLSTSGWQSYGTLVISGSDLSSGSNTLYVLAGNEYFWGDDSPNFNNPTQSNPYAQYNPGAAIFQLDVEYEETPFTTVLCAGQDIPVGNVIVENDGTNLSVTYEITDLDWIITETHLYVGQNTPPTSAPGQFPYDDDDAVVTDTMVTYVIPLGSIDSYSMQLNKKGKPTGVMIAYGSPGVNPGDPVYIAAHAVVEYQTAIIYGTERGGNNNSGPVGGTIYEIDVLGGTVNNLYFTNLDTTSDNYHRNYPNGNAFDAVNNRLYYSVATNNGLYFYDFAGTQTYAGPLAGLSAGGSFYNSKYYYFVNGSDDLRAVSFNPDGTISSDDLFMGDITGNASSWGFGDLVITSGGMLYASPGGAFFKIDLNTTTYTPISTTGAVGMQLAIGSDGVLYAHSAGTGDFYTVDPSDGSITGPIVNLNQFTDLASGALREPIAETAWGGACDEENYWDGETGFVFFFNPGQGGNWASYFEYTIQ